jgi:hypothetical protein
MDVWSILNSEFTLLVLGFIFTTLAGALISWFLQKRTWYRQTRVDLFRKRHEQGSELLDQLSRLIGARSFALQRLLWALESGDDKEITRWQTIGGKIVFRWNENRWNFRNKIRLLLGEPQATAFLDDRDYDFPETPASVHYRFVKAHQYALYAKDGQIDLQTAQDELDDLQRICTLFLEALTTDFADRANTLVLLEDAEEPAIRKSVGPASARGIGQIIDTSRLKLLPRASSRNRSRRRFIRRSATVVAGVDQQDG